MGSIEALVAGRQADLLRQAGHVLQGHHSGPPEAGRQRAHGERRRAVSRGVGRVLVSVGVRLAGPEALRGRIALVDGRR